VGPTRAWKNVKDVRTETGQSAIVQAFAGAWNVLETRNLSARFREHRELKAELNQRLMVLASEGVTDPIELRRQALASFPLV
jgi:hypothetical protein